MTFWLQRWRVIFPACFFLAGRLLAAEPDMVLVPAGYFNMGDAQAVRRDALPVHRVWTDAVLMDRCEITATQMWAALNWARDRHWIKLEGAGVFNTSGERKLLLDLSNPLGALHVSDGQFILTAGREQWPCVWVSWWGALAYCAIRTAMENEAGAQLDPGVDFKDWCCRFAATGYRLPTEAEWEKAARGGLEGQQFPWPSTNADFSNDISPSKANYIESIENSGNDPRPVGSYRLSRPFSHPWGLCDMAGNVAEWCWDWYDADTYTLYPPRDWPRNPTGPPASLWSGRVLRGGSWYSIAQQLRCAHRSQMMPDSETAFVGFRTVRRVTPLGGTGNPQEMPMRLTGADRTCIEADWMEQDFPELRSGRTPDLRASASNAWVRTQRTLAMVQRQWAATATPGAQPTQLQMWARRLEQLHTTLGRPETDREFWLDQYLALRWLRREIVFSSPLLQFDTLLFYRSRPSKYTSNLVDSNAGRWSQAGGGISRLEHWRTAPVLRSLFSGQLPPGGVENMDLDFDARHVVFSFCSHAETNETQRAYHLFEGVTDGSAWRQLTGDPKIDPLRGEGGWHSAVIEDLDPIYLPDGDVAFMSTRCQSFSRCHVGRYAPSFVLYRMSRTNCAPRRLCYMESNEWTPTVLNDGRIAFTQWDYVNRHEVLFQGLWSCLPDGAEIAHIYGNYSPNPCAVVEARAIPDTRELVAVAAGHHSLPGGSLLLIDPARGQDGEPPLTRLTPEICFPETEGWPCGSYMFPWPLSKELMLVSYSPDPVPCHWEMGRANAYGLYVFDIHGGRELIYRDAQDSCYKPIPLQPRPLPPQPVSDAPAQAAAEATVIIRDVRRSTVPLADQPMAGLRVVQLLEQHPQSPLSRGANQIDFARRIIGTATIQPDGSAAFRVPANATLQFQLLDDRQRALLSMRSQVFFRPGELRSCVGCHENRLTTPPTDVTAWRGTVQTLRPPPGPQYAGGFSFARIVQPILDRYCIRCHGATRHTGMPDLRGTPRGIFSTAYASLTARPDLTAMAWRRHESIVSRVGEYGALAASLPRLLETTHAKRVKLDAASWECLMEWLDLNCPFYGDYGPVRPERRRTRAAGEIHLRAEVHTLCAQCHAGLDQQPLQTLINPALPLESRILQAPLATTAGGWGQCRGVVVTNYADEVFQRLGKAVLDTLSPPTETNTVDTATDTTLGCP